MNFILLAESTGTGLSFMIKHLVDFELFGVKLSITTTHIAMVIVDLILIIFAIAAKRAFRHPKDVPGTFQNVVELIVEMLDNLVHDNMGANAGKFVNYIGSIFLFILLSNISGLIGLRSPTADYGVTLLLGIVTCIMIHFNGIRTKGIGYYKKLLDPFPVFLPINIISDVATPISLSLRLFGNVMSGTVMLGLWYSMMPWFFNLGIPSFLHIYFDLFSGAIQTYVFCMLTMVYVQDAMSTED